MILNKFGIKCSNAVLSAQYVVAVYSGKVPTAVNSCGKCMVKPQPLAIVW